MTLANRKSTLRRSVGICRDSDVTPLDRSSVCNLNELVRPARTRMRGLVVSQLVIDATADRATISIRHGTTEIELPALWLRERSQRADALDARTGQRLFDPHQLPADLFLRRAVADADQTVEILFSDGHMTTFDQRRLLSGLLLDDGLPATEMWTSALGAPPTHDWNSFDVAGRELTALDDFLRLGVIVIENVATVPGTLSTVASRFGYIRETNFGTTFDVRSIPNSNDLAYRSVALGPHTDNPYRMPVPGIQLLHCLVNETTGGQSSLVDGLAVVARLGEEDPAAVDLLADVAVRFRFRDDDTEIVAIRPIIDRRPDGTVTGLNYSPKLDETPLMPTATMQRFQAAKRRLAELLNDDQFAIRFTLGAGHLMMFDNNRVLHGRTSFDPNEGLRHLQGCYIDHDGPGARYRVLSRRDGFS